MDLVVILGTPLFALLAVVAIGYRLSEMHKVRAALLAPASRLKREVGGLRTSLRRASAAVERARSGYVDAHRRRLRAATPVETLRDAGADRVRWGSLREAGISTLADLDGIYVPRLTSLPGIGEVSARKIAAAAQTLRRALDAKPVPPADAALEFPEARAVVEATRRSHDAEAALAAPVARLERIERKFAVPTNRAARQLGVGAWMFGGYWANGDTRGMTDARVLTSEIRAALADAVSTGARDVADLRPAPTSIDEAEPTARPVDRPGAVAARVATAARFARIDSPPETDPMPAPPQRPVAFEASIQFGVGPSRPLVSDVVERLDQVAEPAPTYGRAFPRWIPPGETVVVAGFELQGGMLYVGNSALIRDEPCLIDPSLPLDRLAPDRTGASMGYWPSYARISAQSRAAYLEWLVGGRRNALFDVGYAFLFFYGLERRLLLDRSLCEPGEIDAILVEVERLLDLYGDVRSFRNYAGSFLAAIRTSRPSPRLYVGDPPPPSQGAPSDVLRIGLGQAAADATPLPAAWAFAWYLADPTVRFSYAASRCPEEFARLFALRYAAECGDGIVVPPGKNPLVLQYKAASSGFRGPTSVPTGLTEVLGRYPPKRIKEIAESCVRDLDGFARGRGRKTSNPLAHVALLPAELVPAQTDERLSRLRAWLEETAQVGAPTLVTARDLFTRWSEFAPGRLPKKEVTELALVLGRLGFAIDPDPRFGGGAMLATDRVALFRTAPGAASAPSPAYAGAALMIRLAAAVACADDQATRGERERLEEIADAMEGLDAPERLRLRAYGVRLFETNATLGSIAKLVATFPTEARERLGSMLVGVAAVDGHVSAKEIVVLTKVFSALELDPAGVYREAHARSTDTFPADEPVVVQRPASPCSDRDYAIRPPAPKAAAAARGVRIDERLLARKQAETAEVLAMLAPIFADEPGAAAAPPVAKAPAASDVPGLDVRHAALIRRLVERSSWTRDDVEGVCEDLGLLTDGALEVVNDAAFEHAGCAVVEGEGPLDVDQEAIRSWMK